MYPIYEPIGTKEECKEVNIGFPPQQQELPGFEYKMCPRPISNNPDYIGSGKLKDKVAIITGGDSGIGRAVAYAFVKEGAHVAISYLDEHIDAKETKAAIENSGGKCILIPGDLRYPSTSKEVVEKTLNTFGKIDILINNQGMQVYQESILDISIEQLTKTFETNVFGYFYLTQAVLSHLKKGATIVNTTSITSYEGNANMIDYSATNGARTSFTRSLALSLVDKGIRVNGVAPGPIWTPLQPSSQPLDEIVIFGSDSPMGRAGQPFEVATSYVFLASDDSSYMTGQVLHPNGGTIVTG
jgi:NAD(P)-dependent dehydrogenase (short-subunit alcohol dehydrogenase family)